MSDYKYINLREKPELNKTAANWVHEKWGVPTEAYLECIDAYIESATEYGWEFFCMAQGDGEPEPTRLYIHR